MATAIYGICAFILFFFAVFRLPRSIRKPRPSSKQAFHAASFPPGFLWGSATDAYQHEGGNENADWAVWEKSEPRPLDGGVVSGRCADFWNRWEEDLDLAAGLGLGAFRIGLEWSRIEPSMGFYDQEALSRYGEILEGMKKMGFAVFVNLWHFTLPLWAAEEGGFESEKVFRQWKSYVRLCAERFGGLVDYWSTTIDAQIYALRGFALGEIPPCEKNMEHAVKVYAKLVEVHAAAYATIKEASPRGKGAKVGLIWFFQKYQSAGNPLDSFVRAQLDAIFNRAFLDALRTGRLDISVAFGPRLKAEIPGAKGSLDWLGINFYTREIVEFSPRAPGMVARKTCAESERSDMGWEIYPQGLAELILDLGRRYPGVELFVTENGLADGTDSKRPLFILAYLSSLLEAIDQGAKVSGYFHWSLTDNLEWKNGFWPKFGLFRLAEGSLEREETRSARLYRFIAKNSRLPSNAELGAIR